MGAFGNISTQGRYFPANPDQQMNFSISPALSLIQNDNSSSTKTETPSSRANSKPVIDKISVDTNKGLPDSFDKFIEFFFIDEAVEQVERALGTDLQGGKTCNVSATRTQTNNVSNGTITVDVSGQTVSTSDFDSPPYMTTFGVQMHLWRGERQSSWGRQYEVNELGGRAQGTHSQTLNFNDDGSPLFYELEIYGVCEYTDGTLLVDEHPRITRVNQNN
jgi:hypothetical protein